MGAVGEEVKPNLWWSRRITVGGVLAALLAIWAVGLTLVQSQTGSDYGLREECVARLGHPSGLELAKCLIANRRSGLEVMLMRGRWALGGIAVSLLSPAVARIHLRRLEPDNASLLVGQAVTRQHMRLAIAILAVALVVLVVAYFLVVVSLEVLVRRAAQVVHTWLSGSKELEADPSSSTCGPHGRKSSQPSEPAPSGHADSHGGAASGISWLRCRAYGAGDDSGDGSLQPCHVQL